jgi:hypothetical protein
MDIRNGPVQRILYAVTPQSDRSGFTRFRRHGAAALVAARALAGREAADAAAVWQPHSVIVVVTTTTAAVGVGRLEPQQASLLPGGLDRQCVTFVDRPSELKVRAPASVTVPLASVPKLAMDIAGVSHIVIVEATGTLTQCRSAEISREIILLALDQLDLAVVDDIAGTPPKS